MTLGREALSLTSPNLPCVYDIAVSCRFFCVVPLEGLAKRDKSPLVDSSCLLLSL